MRVDKTEARLKALLKQGANKRCINCDSLVSWQSCRALRLEPDLALGCPHHALPSCLQGPQYVVSSFNVFVCTVCSGVQ
jgi:predicted transcriptional regulator